MTIGWSLIAAPPAANATIDDPGSLQTGVTLDNVLGDYVFRLSVSDGAFDATDDVRITVIQVGATATRTHWQLME